MSNILSPKSIYTVRELQYRLTLNLEGQPLCHSQDISVEALQCSFTKHSTPVNLSNDFILLARGNLLHSFADNMLYDGVFGFESTCVTHKI